MSWLHGEVIFKIFFLFHFSAPLKYHWPIRASSLENHSPAGRIYSPLATGRVLMKRLMKPPLTLDTDSETVECFVPNTEPRKTGCFTLSKLTGLGLVQNYTVFNTDLVLVQNYTVFSTDHGLVQKYTVFCSDLVLIQNYSVFSTNLGVVQNYTVFIASSRIILCSNGSGIPPSLHYTLIPSISQFPLFQND